MEELREEMEMENDFGEVEAFDDEVEMTTVEHLKGIGRNTKKWFKAHWKGIAIGGLTVIGAVAAIEKLVSSTNTPELPDNSCDNDNDFDVITEISDDGQTMTTRIVYPEDNNVEETNNGIEL